MDNEIVPSAEGVTTRASPLSVRETLDRLQQALRSKGFTVFAHIDHGANAAGAGLQMQDAQILMFGNAKAGTPLMVASPLLALDLPLRVLVWQDYVGRVWVSYTNPSILASRYAIPPDLVGNIAGIDGLVEGAIGAQKERG